MGRKVMLLRNIRMTEALQALRFHLIQMLFQMTKDGMALRATIGASKVWIDDELNNLPD